MMSIDVRDLMIRAQVTAVVVAGVCAVAVAPVGAQQNTSPNAQETTITLSDPSRPATITVNLMRGMLTVRGTNRKDILVTARASDRDPGDRDRDRDRDRTRGPRSPRGPGAGRGGAPQPDTDVPPGFRRLTPPGGVSIDERNNEVSIGGSFMRHVDLELQVPTRTDLRVHGVATGSVAVEKVDGDLEINTVTGPVTLTDISGTVVVQAVSAPVTATLSRVAPDKPMSFASFTGNVDVTLPASVKANFKLRSGTGDVFTNFDLQTKGAAPPPRKGAGEPLEPFVIFNDAIYGTVNGGGPEIELRTFNGRVMLRKGS